MCEKKVTLNALYDLLKKVPMTDRQRVVDLAFNAVKPEIDKIANQYEEYFGFYSQLQAFAYNSGQDFVVYTSAEKQLLDSKVNGELPEIPVKVDTSETTDVSAKDSADEVDMSNGNDDDNLKKVTLELIPPEEGNEVNQNSEENKEDTSSENTDPKDLGEQNAENSIQDVKDEKEEEKSSEDKVLDEKEKTLNNFLESLNISKEDIKNVLDFFSKIKDQSENSQNNEVKTK